MHQTTDERLRENELTEIILGLVRLGDCGVICQEESVEIELTGRRDGYRVEVKNFRRGNLDS